MELTKPSREGRVFCVVGSVGEGGMFVMCYVVLLFLVYLEVRAITDKAIYFGQDYSINYVFINE